MIFDEIISLLVVESNLWFLRYLLKLNAHKVKENGEITLNIICVPIYSCVTGYSTL